MKGHLKVGPVQLTIHWFRKKLKTTFQFSSITALHTGDLMSFMFYCDITILLS